MRWLVIYKVPAPDGVFCDFFEHDDIDAALEAAAQGGIPWLSIDAIFGEEGGEEWSERVIVPLDNIQTIRQAPDEDEDGSDEGPEDGVPKRSIRMGPRFRV